MIREENILVMCCREVVSIGQSEFRNDTYYYVLIWRVLIMEVFFLTSNSMLSVVKKKNKLLGYDKPVHQMAGSNKANL